MKSTAIAVLWCSMGLFETVMGAKEVPIDIEASDVPVAPVGTAPAVVAPNNDTLDTLAKMLQVVALAKRQEKMNKDATEIILKTETEGMSDDVIIKTVKKCFADWGIPESVIQDLLPEGNDEKKSEALEWFKTGQEGKDKQCRKVLLGDYFADLIDSTDKTKLQMWAKAIASGDLENLRHFHNIASEHGYSELVLNFPIVEYLNKLFTKGDATGAPAFLQALAGAADRHETRKKSDMPPRKTSTLPQVDSPPNIRRKTEGMNVKSPSSDQPHAGRRTVSHGVPFHQSPNYGRLEPGGGLELKTRITSVTNSNSDPPKFNGTGPGSNSTNIGPSQGTGTGGNAGRPQQGQGGDQNKIKSVVQGFGTHSEKPAIPITPTMITTDPAAPLTTTSPSTNSIQYWKDRLSEPFKQILEKYGSSFWTEETAKKAKEFEATNTTVNTDTTIPGLEKHDGQVLAYLLNNLPDEQEKRLNIAEVASRLYLNLLGVTDDNVNVLGSTQSEIFSVVKNAKEWSMERRIRALMLNSESFSEKIVSSSGNLDHVSVARFLSWACAWRNKTREDMVNPEKLYNSGNDYIKRLIENIPDVGIVNLDIKIEVADEKAEATRKIVVGIASLNGESTFLKVAEAIPPEQRAEIVNNFYDNIPQLFTEESRCSDLVTYKKKLHDHMLEVIIEQICTFPWDHIALFVFSNSLSNPDSRAAKLDPTETRNLITTTCGSKMSKIEKLTAIANHIRKRTFLSDRLHKP